MADGTSVVSDRWGTSAGPRALRERSQYASRLRLPAAAENRRNCSQVSPCAGRLPSGRGPNADRPFDEPATSTARRVAAATWMMSSTTVASRAYAVVPARRSRWSRGGASRPSSAPAAGSARHRADANGVGIQIPCSLWKRPVGVTWLFPPSEWGKAVLRGLTDVSVGTSVGMPETVASLPEEEKLVYASLHRWTEELAGYDFARDADTPYYHARTISYDGLRRARARGT